MKCLDLYGEAIYYRSGKTFSIGVFYVKAKEISVSGKTLVTFRSTGKGSELRVFR